MEEQPYLVFSLNDTFYGIEAKWVKEIFFLPELTPVVNASRNFVGLLNWRGKILPVMDLNLRLFGYRCREYCTSDSTIVLEQQNIDWGIIVDRVCNIHPLSPSKIVPNFVDEDEIEGDTNWFQMPLLSKLITGVAHLGTDLIMLLDCEGLMENQEVAEINDSDHKIATELPKFEAIFCPNATPQEREIFRQRSQQLQQVPESLEVEESIHIAVIGLSGEYFGIDLRWVREFAKITQLTPVPCCPKHILGNTNLRGEIVTLVAIQSLLNLPISESPKASQVVVVQVEDWMAGITVDEVLDTIEIHQKAIVPKLSTGFVGDRSYVSGTAPYQEKLISFLDLPKIFDQGELVVDEEVC
jgi:purine-binding chemotaxis protein CheW